MTHVEKQVEELGASAAVSEERVNAIEPSHDEDPALQRLFGFVVARDTVVMRTR